MSSIVLSDNDIILKLAAFNLLNEACLLLNVKPQDVFVLSTAYYVFTRNCERLSSIYTKDGMQRAIDFVKTANSINDTGDSEEIETLKSIEGMDPGETLLIAATKNLPDYIVLTDDKRCITALSTCQEAGEIHRRLCGRIVRFEELIRALILTEGFDKVRNAIAAGPCCDKAMLIVFGSLFQNCEEQVLAAIHSRIKDLEQKVGSNWLWCYRGQACL